MANHAYEEHYTKEDYYQWQGDWEIVYGHAYAMVPSPSFRHQLIGSKIIKQLLEQTENCQKCHALYEIDIEFSEDTVVCPDCIIICHEPDERITKAPEIIFEIISKSTAKRDEQLKFELYQDEGVKYYIIVYPDSNKAKVYHLNNGKYIKVGDFSEESSLFTLDECEINMDFSKIWKK